MRYCAPSLFSMFLQYWGQISTLFFSMYFCLIMQIECVLTNTNDNSRHRTVLSLSCVYSHAYYFKFGVDKLCHGSNFYPPPRDHVSCVLFFTSHVLRSKWSGLCC